jgi:hypothetical protein
MKINLGCSRFVTNISEEPTSRKNITLKMEAAGSPDTFVRTENKWYTGSYTIPKS